MWAATDKALASQVISRVTELFRYCSFAKWTQIITVIIYSALSVEVWPMQSLHPLMTCKNVFDVLGDFYSTQGCPISKVRRSQRARYSEVLLHMCLPRIGKERSVGFSFAQDLRLVQTATLPLEFSLSTPSCSFTTLAFLHQISLLDACPLPPYLQALPTLHIQPEFPMKLSLIISGRRELLSLPRGLAACLHVAQATDEYLSPTTKLTPRGGEFISDSFEHNCFSVKVY